MKLGRYITLKHEIKYEVEEPVDSNFSVKETYQMRPFESVIVCENNRYCEIKGVRKKHTLDIDVVFPNNKYVVKFYQPNDTVSEIKDAAKVFMKALKERSALKALETVILPKIYDANDNVVGKFENYFVDTGNPTQNYNALKLDYFGKEYIIYKTISHIDESAVWAVYENNEKVVAEIQVVYKKGLARRDLFRYDIYVEDDSYFDLACILTVAWMKMTGEEELQNQKTNLVDLKQKYNKEFVENIRNHINPAYLPENMPLVEELYKKGKFDPQRWGVVIVVGAVFLVLAILFLTSFFNK